MHPAFPAGGRERRHPERGTRRSARTRARPRHRGPAAGTAARARTGRGHRQRCRHHHRCGDLCPAGAGDCSRRRSSRRRRLMDVRTAPAERPRRCSSVVPRTTTPAWSARRLTSRRCDSLTISMRPDSDAHTSGGPSRRISINSLLPECRLHRWPTDSDERFARRFLLGARRVVEQIPLSFDRAGSA